MAFAPGFISLGAFRKLQTNVQRKKRRSLARFNGPVSLVRLNGQSRRRFLQQQRQTRRFVDRSVDAQVKLEQPSWQSQKGTGSLEGYRFWNMVLLFGGIAGFARLVYGLMERPMPALRLLLKRLLSPNGET
jgi:hypothetical protein